jgi:hypothetical protein
MGICGQNEERRKDIEEVVKECKNTLQREIMSLDIEIKSLDKELESLNEKRNFTTNIKEKEKIEIENELYKKIKEIEEMKLEKGALEDNLELLKKNERNNRTAEILDRINNLLKTNGKRPTNIIAENNAHRQEQKKQNELTKNLYIQGRSISNGPESQFEKRKEIDNYFKV